MAALRTSRRLLLSATPPLEDLAALARLAPMRTTPVAKPSLTVQPLICSEPTARAITPALAERVTTLASSRATAIAMSSSSYGGPHSADAKAAPRSGESDEVVADAAVGEGSPVAGE